MDNQEKACAIIENTLTDFFEINTPGLVVCYNKESENIIYNYSINKEIVIDMLETVIKEIKAEEE